MLGLFGGSNSTQAPDEDPQIHTKPFLAVKIKNSIFKTGSRSGRGTESEQDTVTLISTQGEFLPGFNQKG